MTEPENLPRYSGRSFMTQKQFIEEADNMEFRGGALLYVEATQQFVTQISDLLDSTKNFKELKTELTKICHERKEFLKFANRL
jgi:hypothetical protein